MGAANFVMMKTLLLLIALFTLAPVMASAQKAYEAVEYSASHNNLKFQFTLGNGYLGASQVRLLQKDAKPVKFYPESNVPDNKDQLIFRAAKYHDYFIMNSMHESYDQVPKIVIGRYWSGKTWSVIKFVLGR